MQPQLIAQYVNAAHAANQQGQPAKAVEFSQMALALNPGMAEAWFNLGIAQARLGQKSAAISALEQARLRCLDSAEGQNSIGLHLLELGAIEIAANCLMQAIKLAPNYAYAHSNLGKLYRKQQRLAQAEQHVKTAIDLAPGEPLLYVNLAGIYLDLKQHDEAEECCRRALDLAPDLPQAWVNLSATLQKQQKLDAAEEAACRALKLAAQLPEAWESLGGALSGQRRFNEAETAFKKAVALNPQSAQAWSSLAALYGLQSRYPLAETAFRKSLDLDDQVAETWGQLGLALKELKRHEESLDCLRKAYVLHPAADNLLCWKLMAQAMVCDWHGRDQELDELAHVVSEGKASADPLSVMALLDNPETQRIAATRYTQLAHPYGPGQYPVASTNDKRVRIGYFSADFRDHPVTQLLVELLECHDRTRFEVFGFSFSPKSESTLGQRIVLAFDHFLEVGQMNDRQLVAKAREEKLEIAINLSGHTAGSRTNIFAQRIAPIQVNYLGYPGTMGAEYMDYLITDAVVCPPGSEAWYTEKLARLPGCFMPHDSQQAISGRARSREEFGLPENGFVFCCFNNHYKLNPEVFNIWMRLLRQVEGAVLWLSDGPELMKNNLQQEARSRGIDPDRLVFAKRVDEMADHLARYRLADLFLDTLPYNAHTTACDALWAGVPVLTRTGKSFASRVAASLLHVAGLPELITDSPEAYEALALTLARDPSRLESVRQKLHGQRITSELFNTKKLARDIESLFALMYQRRIDGLPTDHITVNTTA